MPLSKRVEGSDDRAELRDVISEINAERVKGCSTLRKERNQGVFHILNGRLGKNVSGHLSLMF